MFRSRSVMAPRFCSLILLITIYASEAVSEWKVAKPHLWPEAAAAAAAAAIESLLRSAWTSTPSDSRKSERLVRKEKTVVAIDLEGSLMERPDSAERLHMITVVGAGDVKRAKLVQFAIKRTMGPNDAISHVCGPEECAQKAEGLDDVNIMPDPHLPSSITSYQIAGTVKFPYAMIHIVQKEYNQTNGGPNMAKWFLLKDYDTYVNAERLMAQVSEYDPMKPYAFASQMGGCTGVCGGAGVLVSRALATELAFTDAHKWQSKMMDDLISRGLFYYDLAFPAIVNWVNGSQLINLPSMNPFGPMDDGCITAPTPPPPPAHNGCYEVPECKCAQSTSPATWHVKFRLEEAVGRIMAADH